MPTFFQALDKETTAQPKNKKNEKKKQKKKKRYFSSRLIFHRF